jgi:hypothetical protein
MKILFSFCLGGAAYAFQLREQRGVPFWSFLNFE